MTGDAPARIATLDLIRGEYAQRIETWEQWDEVSKQAHGEPAEQGSAA